MRVVLIVLTKVPAGLTMVDIVEMGWRRGESYYLSRPARDKVSKKERFEEPWDCAWAMCRDGCINRRSRPSKLRGIGICMNKRDTPSILSMQQQSVMSYVRACVCPTSSAVCFGW